MKYDDVIKNLLDLGHLFSIFWKILCSKDHTLGLTGSWCMTGGCFASSSDYLMSKKSNLVRVNIMNQLMGRNKNLLESLKLKQVIKSCEITNSFSSYWNKFLWWCSVVEMGQNYRNLQLREPLAIENSPETKLTQFFRQPLYTKLIITIITTVPVMNKASPETIWFYMLPVELN